MKIKKISYLGPKLDLENDCLDVFVTLENDDCYLIEVTTPKFFYTLMEKFKSNFVPPSYPYRLFLEICSKRVVINISSPLTLTLCKNNSTNRIVCQRFKIKYLYTQF